MNTGQTVYEQLQEILNKCIELSIREPSKYSNKVKCTDGGITYHEEDSEYDCYMSYHELFSKDSGLMEFVEWGGELRGEMYGGEYSNINIKKDGGFEKYYSYEKEYHYMIMGTMTSEEKCNFFVKNAIIPTK